MARTTDKPRLATITPEEVAADVDERLLAYLGGLSLPSPGISLRVEHHGQSDLALAASALAVYAQRGLPVWDWETHGEAEDACASLVRHLYGCPADAVRSDHVGPLAETLDDADLDDPLDLVLVAAWARVELSKGNPVTARQLAALAGLDPDVVRRMGREGEIHLGGGRPARATAAEAHRWLTARGVRGLLVALPCQPPPRASSSGPDPASGHGGALDAQREAEGARRPEEEGHVSLSAHRGAGCPRTTKPGHREGPGFEPAPAREETTDHG